MDTSLRLGQLSTASRRSKFLSHFLFSMNRSIPRSHKKYPDSFLRERMYRRPRFDRFTDRA